MKVDKLRLTCTFDQLKLAIGAGATEPTLAPAETEVGSAGEQPTKG